jgi:hypothetical protein
VNTRSGSTWTQQQKITASDAAVDDYFGESVALSSSGDTAIVGAPRKNTNIGAVYVLTRSGSTWSQQQKFIGAGATSSSNFGISVALSSLGDTALVGSYGEASTGAAYVFVRSGTTWTQQHKFTAPTATTQYLGNSVSLSGSGDIAIVGAPGNNTTNGEAFLYTRSGTTWTQQQTITSADGAAFDNFGNSVAISGLGNTSLVGAFLKNSDTGAAYFYATKFNSSCTQTALDLKGTANGKSLASPWTALSNITVRTNESLLVCVSTLGTLSAGNGVTWNGLTMTQNVINTVALPAVAIYSLSGATAGTGNIVVSTDASATSAISAITVNDFLSTPLDQQTSANGSSTAPSSGATASTTQTNEFIFGCIGTNGPIENAAGTWSSSFANEQRGGTTGAGAASNSTASSASLFTTSTGTFTAAKTGITSRPWAAAVATYKVATPPTCQTYGSCNRIGAIEYSAGNGLRICDGTSWRQLKTVP